MIYMNGHLARPLDAVFSNPSKVAALRALARSRGTLSGRAVALRGGVNHQSAANALAELKGLGLVRSFSSGRSVQWSLDRRRWLVEELLVPLLTKEADHSEQVSGAVKKTLKGRAAAAFLAGDAAKGRIKPGKPLELVVVEGARGRRAAGDAVRELTELLGERFGIGLEARVLPKREALRAAALEDLWELLPTEGRPTYLG